MLEPFDHDPVMVDEVVQALRLSKGSHAADLTAGAAGHSRRIAEAIMPAGRLLALDRDPTYLERVRRRLEPWGENVTVVCQNYDRLPEVMTATGATFFDAILLDAGASSMHFDDASRGFSFAKDGPLDMRMDPRSGRTAADLVAQASVGELERIFFEYGEEPRARAIAKRIVDIRRRVPIVRTRELAELVRATVGGAGRVHPATKVFQALRIAVNDELGALARGIDAAIAALRPGGRFVVLTFHSLEEKVAKECFRRAKAANLVIEVVDPPQLPTAAEIEKNPRSRSAKLRAVEKKATSTTDVIKGI